jgi:hypothetical protein
MTRAVAVVAHTHWDREWYEPFEVFRSRLVGVLDAVLDQLETDPEFPHFLLDGQVAAVDDYLSVRPESAGRIRSLVGAGRLSVGPWYTLMDEFCVSGETIVRNLQLGRQRANALGGAMPVGYLPDMFGHVAQMPQLLQLAGLDHAVVWRGVPAAVGRTGFWWSSPDGSRVRAEYLPVGYANGAFLPGDPDSLLRRLVAHEIELGPFLADGPLLLMNGTDHQSHQAHLPAVLAAANQAQDHFRFQQSSLAGYLGSAPIHDLAEWTGELRSGARAPILAGVLSNRVDVKGAAAAAERAIERLAEPLASLWLPPGHWPAELFDEAWLHLIRNSAHDSICACSADSVGRAVRRRYDSALGLGGEVIRSALAIAAVATPVVGALVVNAASGQATGVVEVVLPGTDPVANAQVLETTLEAVEVRDGLGRDLAQLLGQLAADGWLPGGRARAASVHAGAGGVDLRLDVDASQPPDLEVAAAMAEAWAQAGAHGDQPLRIHVARRASQRVAARVAGVPGYGWAPFAAAPLGSEAVAAGAAWLSNGLVRVDVDANNGTFALDGRPGFDRLVDGGDEGDTYNYSPPGSDRIVDTPEQVRIELIAAGPVVGRLRVVRAYSWPAALCGGERVGRVPVEVVTELELRAGEPLVRVTTSFDNPVRDHRLRTWLPLGAPVHETVAECAFGTVTRGRPDGGRLEPALGTYPSRRWVRAGDVTVTHEGLLEHELVADGSALAITLLRATGILSRAAPPARPNQAGPPLPLDGPQLIGPHRVRYAVAVGDHDPWRLADLAWVPLPVVHSTGGGPLPAAGSRLTVTGAEVSSLRRVDRDGPIEVRVFNPSDAPATVAIPGHTGWLVDLTGSPVAPFDGSFPLRPWGIATARLDAPSLDTGSLGP